MVSVEVQSLVGRSFSDRMVIGRSVMNELAS